MNRNARRYVRDWVDGITLPRPTAPGPPAPEFSFPVRQFLKNVLYEAFDERLEEEGARRLDLTPARPVSIENVARLLDGPLGRILKQVLDDAYSEAGENWRGRRVPRDFGMRVLLIDILVVVNRRWCGIWPFCRASL